VFQVLDLDASRMNGNRWADIFHNIPALQDTIPLAAATSLPMTYLRGLAPFLDLSTPKSDDSASSKSRKGSVGAGELEANCHPFKALRVRGIVHALQKSGSASHCMVNGCQDVVKPKDREIGIPIPGFQRIVMVLYKPCTRFLVETLEYSMGEYGAPWKGIVAAQVAAQQAEAAKNNTTNAAAGDSDDAAANPPQPIEADPVETEKLLREYLDELLRSEQEEDLLDERGFRVLRQVPNLPKEDVVFDFVQHKVPLFPKEKMTLAKIAAMEDRYCNAGSGRLEWEDIEYAYAYEGVICPGGKVMMGRWWRVGLDGAGVNDGWELDGEGCGVKVEGGEGWVRMREEEGDESGMVVEVCAGGEERWRRSKKGLERGPFVFWT
jgi:hypothetical protein